MRRVLCPACRERAGVPIVYGMPTVKMAEAVERGDWDVVLGGCSVEPVTAHCRACGHQWQRRWQRRETHGDAR